MSSYEKVHQSNVLWYIRECDVLKERLEFTNRQTSMANERIRQLESMLADVVVREWVVVRGSIPSFRATRSIIWV